jgi:hypothetical protein
MGFLLGNDIDKKQVFNEIKKYTKITTIYPDKPFISFRQHSLKWKNPYTLLVVSINLDN